jgi:hypothetical protein
MFALPAGEQVPGKQPVRHTTPLQPVAALQLVQVL